MNAMPRRFYIQTVGCQMNVLDSELVAAELRRAGYQQVDRPGQADMILLNTCSVRQHAEDKIYSALGRLKVEKQERPGMIIGVLGCMAQKDQHEILRRAPHVDLVVGPGQLGRLPALIEQIAAGGGPRVEVSLDRARRRSGGGPAELRPVRPAANGRRRKRPPLLTARAPSGDGADHVRLRQVLHLLRRAPGPRAGAKPAGRRNPRRSPPPGRPRLPGSDPAGPDGQQLQGHDRPEHDRTGRPALPAARHRRHPAAEVRHEPSAAHDGRLVAGGPRSAEGFALSARPRPERLERGAAADECAATPSSRTARCSRASAR